MTRVRFARYTRELAVHVLFTEAVAHTRMLPVFINHFSRFAANCTTFYD